MDFLRLLSLSYYFTPRPDPNFRYTAFLIGLGILLIMMGILLNFYRRHALQNEVLKKMLKRTPMFFKIFGSVMIVLTLIRIAGIQYLSMRIFWIIYGLLFLYYAVTRVFQFKKQYQMRRHQITQQSQKNRYLPHKK